MPIRVHRALLPAGSPAPHFEHWRAYFNAVPNDWLTRSVVFFDPDIGLQTGTPGYMRERGMDKYLMYKDLSDVAARATAACVMVVVPTSAERCFTANG
jgi:hypothetical protein